eukprot:IDg16677t1
MAAGFLLVNCVADAGGSSMWLGLYCWPRVELLSPWAMAVDGRCFCRMTSPYYPGLATVWPSESRAKFGELDLGCPCDMVIPAADVGEWTYAGASGFNTDCVCLLW